MTARAADVVSEMMRVLCVFILVSVFSAEDQVSRGGHDGTMNLTQAAVNQTLSAMSQMNQALSAMSQMNQTLSAMSQMNQTDTAMSHMNQTLSVMSQMNQTLSAMSQMNQTLSAMSQMNQTLSAMSQMNQTDTAMSQMNQTLSAMSQMNQTLSAMSQMNQTLSAMSQMNQTDTALHRRETNPRTTESVWNKADVSANQADNITTQENTGTGPTNSYTHQTEVYSDQTQHAMNHTTEVANVTEDIPTLPETVTQHTTVADVTDDIIKLPETVTQHTTHVAHVTAGVMTVPDTALNQTTIVMNATKIAVNKTHDSQNETDSDSDSDSYSATNETDSTMNMTRVAVNFGGIGMSQCRAWSCENRCFKNTAAVSFFVTTTTSSPTEITASIPPFVRNATKTDVKNCACDNSCLTLGDCCVDFFSLCLNVTNETEVVAILEHALFDSGNGSEDGENVELKASRVLRSYGSCVKTPEGDRFSMVTSCPELFEDADVAKTCEDAENYPGLQPYSDASYMTLTFRNVHCARCHGYEEGRLVPWLQGVKCQETDGSGDSVSHDRSTRHESPGDELSELFAAVKSGECTYIFRPPSDSLTQPRSCISPPSEDLDALPGIAPNPNTTTGDKKCTFEDLLLCRSYSYQTFTADDREVKNPHCLKCQTGVTPVSVDLPCLRAAEQNENEDKDTRGGILALFSPGSTGSNYIVVDGREIPWPGFLCEDDQVFDYVFLVCRSVFCPPGYRPVGGKCSAVDRYFVPGRWQLMPQRTARLVVDIETESKDVCETNQPLLGRIVQASFDEFFETQADESSSAVPPSLELSCVGSGNERVVSSHRQLHSLHMTVHPVTNLSLILYIVTEAIQNGFEANLIPGDVRITNYETEPKAECTLGNPDIVHDANVTAFDGEMYVENPQRAVAFYYPLSNVVFKIQVTKWNSTNTTTSDDALADSQGIRLVYTALLCVQPQVQSNLNCSSVPFEINRTRVENGTLFITGTDLVYPESQYELHEHFALVCSDFKNLNDLWGTLTFFQFSSAQYYLSLACSLTSVLFLMTSLVTFCVLPHMQNVAGYMTASLAASLASGQLLILVDFIDHPVVCTCLAAVAHECWLAAFSWMTALAVHMTRTFHGTRAANAGRHDRKHALREYRKFALVCWGLPLLLVVACLVLDTVQGTPLKVGYGTPLCGWMQQSYVFLGPVAVALTANVVCFLVTLVSIERTMRVSRSAHSGQPNSDKQRLLVYTKMVCVMGFTWAAGFLAAFTEQPALWWVYILLNGLQGTFIAFSFFLNARLLRFLKAKGTEGKKTKGTISSRTPGAVVQGLSHQSPTGLQRRICVPEQAEVGSDGGDVVLTSACFRQTRSSDSTATIDTSV